MGINTDEALNGIASAVDLDFALVAMPYTLLDQASLNTGMADCVKRGVSVIIGAPFASGILVTGSGGAAHYGYAKARPRCRRRCAASRRCAARTAWPAGRRAAVRARPPGRRLGHPRRRPAERGAADNAASLDRADPGGLLGRPQDRKALIDPDLAGARGTMTHGRARPDRLRQRPRHFEVVRRRRGAARRRPRPDGGRDPRAARRERRRQVDLRQDPRRGAPADPRHARAGRPAGRHPQPDRRPGARHHPDPPGADLVSRPLRRREPRPRPRPGRAAAPGSPGPR